MDKRTGPIAKMRTRPEAPVQYELPIGDGTVPLNALLGRPIRFRFTGRIFCMHCGQSTRSSFNQGYCFKCVQTLAQCDMCIVKPELCHYRFGTCREPEWGEKHCLIEHTVYLANSSGIKVGITRAHQVRTRWMDQGAIQALPIVKVANRFDSGRVETVLARTLPDKTNWRAMLQGKVQRIDLKAERDRLFSAWGADLPGERLMEEEHAFEYPVLAYPAKLVSLNLDKQPEASGELRGIKGQYLILDSGVINMRKYGGYELEWESEAVGAGGAADAGCAASSAGSAPSGTAPAASAPVGSGALAAPAAATRIPTTPADKTAAGPGGTAGAGSAQTSLF